MIYHQSLGGELLLVCGGEPGAGNQLKRAYVSTDQGATWRATIAPDEAGYIEGGAVGSAGALVEGGRMTVQQTTGAAQPWRAVLTGSGEAGGVAQVGFSQLRYGWAVDYGPPSALYLSSDGGRRWHRTPRP